MVHGLTFYGLKIEAQLQTLIISFFIKKTIEILLLCRSNNYILIKKRMNSLHLKQESCDYLNL